jgi:N-acetylmuramoyl-L-alanine amidase
MRSTITHVHRNSATDRIPLLSRMAAVILSMLVTIPALIPTVAALSSYEKEDFTMETEAKKTEASVEIPSSIMSDSGIRTPARPESLAEELTATFDLRDEPTQAPAEDGNITNPHPPTDTLDTPQKDTDTTQKDPYADLFDPTLPLTQELIARRIETKMNIQSKGGSRVYYPYPAGAMAVELYKDGTRILAGQVVDIGGTVYVPVQRFADLFGRFKTVYTEATEQVVITGTNLSITVKVGDPYITVNERIFYTGKKVISLGGWIFVPLTSMSKAVNAKVTIRRGYYDAFITSGDPAKVQWASEYYDSTDLYWLSRIISAEAKGEPFAGQIAVGNVVLNRVRSSQFPNTVKGVIFDTKYGTQFSPVSSGTIYQAPTASAIRAAKVCLEGYSLSTQMIYFYNPSIATSSWIGRTRPYIMTIGNHKFYG